MEFENSSPIELGVYGCASEKVWGCHGSAWTLGAASSLLVEVPLGTVRPLVRVLLSGSGRRDADAGAFCFGGGLVAVSGPGGVASSCPLGCSLPFFFV